MESAWKRKVVRNFESCVGAYDGHAGIQAHAARALAGYLPSLNHPEILEIGCGTGLFTRRLLDRYEDGKFLVTDISPRMIEYARDRIGTAAWWAVMDGERPAFAGRCDLIVANMVFQWFEHVETALPRLLKCLNAKGKIFYSMPGPACFQEWKDILTRLGLSAGAHDFKIIPGVFRQEHITMNYGTALDFLKSIKAMGAQTAGKRGRQLSCRDLRRACRIFDGRITWHILYGCVDSNLSRRALADVAGLR